MRSSPPRADELARINATIRPRDAWFRRSPGAPAERAATLEAAWEIALPAPTETGWLANGASFQGPVRAPMV